jgi:aquaporin TIP
MVTKLVAEALGVFALCFVGILAMSHGSENSLLMVALAHGLTIAVMVGALSGVSGAHFNPAVSIGLMAGGFISPAATLMYVFAQVLGGLVAAALLAALFGPDVVAVGTPAPAGSTTFMQAVVMELIATFLLVLVIAGTAFDPRSARHIFPLMIGIAVVVLILAIGPISGASLNPARVLGPALVGGQWDGHVTYWIGPLAGGTLAVLLYRGVLRPAETEEAS